ncbi:MAG TPA: tRNA (adenosine(37)-N6)-threonylcarbamoyltransferase complex ATPase subunit type 1 TsaE [Terriglobia bacterium]|nr:tRNA (adenosine(37)-N6)-threonylcarbamoyltransferase complex ATPase subunit type 1 TsaE [Terriglobia bacterium]
MQSQDSIQLNTELAARRRYDIVTHSVEETAAFGRELARVLTPPCLVLMKGELGAGKTVLTKGIVTGLGAAPESEVTSPTFALVHEYAGRSKVYHLDLYRIEGARDLATLGLDEMLVENATVIVEWGEKLSHAPAPRFEVHLEHRGENDRRIVVEEIRSD